MRSARPAPASPLRRRTLLHALAGGSVLLGGGLLWQASARTPAQSEGVQLPPPARDLPPGGRGLQKTVLAGGCFWGVQGVYQHVKGVRSAVSGYCGGAADTASYDRVGSGRTGHAESVEVTWDPALVSFGTLLQVFFSVAHDPTQLDRQGPDWGPQYRSAIFAADAAQLDVAKAYVAQLDAAHMFAQPIVTKFETGRVFYPAEAYHQDFLAENPRHPYIVFNDLPKIAQLERLFPERYRAEAVLVKAGR